MIVWGGSVERACARGAKHGWLHRWYGVTIGNVGLGVLVRYKTEEAPRA